MQSGRRLSSGAPVGDGHAGGHLVTVPGAEDDEHPMGCRTIRLQHTIVKILDELALEELREGFRHAGAEGESDLRRLNELCDESVSHEWLWRISGSREGGLESHEFTSAVCTRLGAQHFDTPQLCQGCGRHILDPKCKHASCCAPGASTRGHNSVRDCLLDFARLGDSTAEPEVLGLIASAPGLRPADVLTSALGGNQLSALDVGVAAPDAQRAGEDCTESMCSSKVARYAPFHAELQVAQVVYRPVVWS